MWPLSAMARNVARQMCNLSYSSKTKIPHIALSSLTLRFNSDTTGLNDKTILEQVLDWLQTS
jgi:hypothetical protein